MNCQSGPFHFLVEHREEGMVPAGGHIPSCPKVHCSALHLSNLERNIFPPLRIVNLGRYFLIFSVVSKTKGKNSVVFRGRKVYGRSNFGFSLLD